MSTKSFNDMVLESLVALVAQKMPKYNPDSQHQIDLLSNALSAVNARNADAEVRIDELESERATLTESVEIYAEASQRVTAELEEARQKIENQRRWNAEALARANEKNKVIKAKDAQIHALKEQIAMLQAPILIAASPDQRQHDREWATSVMEKYNAGATVSPDQYAKAQTIIKSEGLRNLAVKGDIGTASVDGVMHTNFDREWDAARQ